MNAALNIAPLDAQSGDAQQECIGRCEWCGVVDHHLLQGECPNCRRRRILQVAPLPVSRVYKYGRCVDKILSNGGFR